MNQTFYPSFITNKTDRFSFKGGCVVQVENDEMRRQLQPNKTKVRLYLVLGGIPKIPNTGVSKSIPLHFANIEIP